MFSCLPEILIFLQWIDEIQDDLGHLFVSLIEDPTGKARSLPSSSSEPESVHTRVSSALNSLKP
jgi:hypothetical protein